MSFRKFFLQSASYCLSLAITLNVCGMGEYGREQRNQLSRVICNGNYENKHHLCMIDNRVKLHTIQCLCDCTDTDDDSIDHSLTFQSHRDFIDTLKVTVDSMRIDSTNLLSRNTAEWILNKPDKPALCVVTPTADSSMRARKNGYSGKQSLFPDPSVSLMNYQTVNTYNATYNKDDIYDNTGIIYKDIGYKAWQNNDIVVLTSRVGNDIRNTLVHEYQHYADKNSGLEYRLVYHLTKEEIGKKHYPKWYKKIKIRKEQEKEDVFRSFMTEFRAHYYSIKPYDLRKACLKALKYPKIKALYESNVSFRGRKFQEVVQEYYKQVHNKTASTTIGLYSMGFNALNSIRINDFYNVIDGIESNRISDDGAILEAIENLDQLEREFIEKSHEWQGKLKRVKNIVSFNIIIFMYNQGVASVGIF